MVINLDNVEVKEMSNKNWLKEDGEYIVVVDSYDKGMTENGTPYIKFEMKTDDERYITTSLYLSEKAMWKFKKFIVALGHPGIGSIDAYEVANHCVGKKIRIVCAHRETINPITNVKEVGKYLEVVDFSKC